MSRLSPQVIDAPVWRPAEQGAERREDRGEAAGGTLPRLLKGIEGEGAMTFEEHLRVHGQLPLARARWRREEPVLIGRLERAGLRGRGGAAFPTATKLRGVRASRGRPIVVVNAAEGEPASLKDATLAELAPHLVLDGGQLATEAVGADELIVCVGNSAPASLRSFKRAIAERERSGAREAPARVAGVPDHYVAGQESALVNYLNGNPPVPTFAPPLPFERGVDRRPTLVNNSETLAQLALIARHGSGWFRQLGTAAEPGSSLITAGGQLARPGVYEIEYGASVSSLIEAAGGSTGPIAGALFGGYAGAWVAAEQLPGLRLSDEHLAAVGAALGAGIVFFLSENACAVAEVARVGRWLATQSTGQCGPCVNGLAALADTVEQVAAGAAGRDAERRIARLSALVHGRGACRHPDGVANFILSALRQFGAQFEDHARHGPCDACGRPAELPLPSMRRAIAKLA